jgi:hypothetical protein
VSNSAFTTLSNLKAKLVLSIEYLARTSDDNFVGITDFGITLL